MSRGDRLDESGKPRPAQVVPFPPRPTAPGAPMVGGEGVPAPSQAGALSHVVPSSGELWATLSVLGYIVEGDEGLRGRLRDLSFDPVSGEIRYALVGVGGVLGVGERLVAISWSLLRFCSRRGVVTAPLRRADVSRARAITIADLRALGVARPGRWCARIGRDDGVDAVY